MAEQNEKVQVEEQTAQTAATTAPVKSMKRGTIIQAVKAVAVLVCICLVCGALLALCNDLFYISDEERFNRSMAKIYPELDLASVKTLELNSEFKSNSTYGEVKSVVTDGKVYIIEALGIGGWQSGTVTLYVIVGSDAKIISWAVKEHTNQSYIDQVPSNAGTTWYNGYDVSNAFDKVQTGSTLKETPIAIGNAVNMAAFYCRSALGVGKNPEADAQKAILALLGEGYADYKLTTAAILGSNATVDKDGKTVKQLLDGDTDEISYVMFADGASGPVTAYVYGQDEATQKIVAIANGEVKLSANLTETDELVAKVTEFNGNFHTVKSGNYNGYGYISAVKATEGTVYTVAGIKAGTLPNTYVLTVTIETVDGKGKVTAITAEQSGYVPQGPSQANTDKLISSLVGATRESIDGLYTENKVSGATQSANLIRVAVESALRDYDANLESND